MDQAYLLHRPKLGAEKNVRLGVVVWKPLSRGFIPNDLKGYSASAARTGEVSAGTQPPEPPDYSEYEDPVYGRFGRFAASSGIDPA